MTTTASLHPVILFAILAGISLYLHLQHRHRSFRYWALAWVVLALRAIGRFAFGRDETGLWAGLEAVLLVAAGATLLLGALAYASRSRMGVWRGALHGLVVGVLAALLLVALRTFAPGLDLVRAAPLAFLAASWIGTGWMIDRYGRATAPLGAPVAGLALAAWGLLEGAEGVIYARGAELPAWLWAIDGAFWTLLVVGMTILGVEETRSRVARERIDPSTLFHEDPGLIAVFQEGRWAFWNRAFEIRTGWRREQLERTGPLDLIAPHDHEEAQRRILGPAEPPDDFEIEMVDAAGRPVPVDVHAEAIEWEGRPALKLELTDITTRRQAEAEIRSINEELQRINAELEKSNQLKTEFLSNTSHELKTPLTSIIANTEILEYEMCGPVNEEQRRVLANISRNSQHLLEMISRLLDFARHEEGHDQLRWERVDLSALLQGVVDTVQPLLEGGGRRIEVQVDPTIEPCYLDAEKIYRVYLNLIENAIKFSTEGTITAAATRTDGEIEGRVRDEGIGIAPEKLDEVFEAFHQVDSSATRTYQGVGLGLAICRQMVEMHGGRIWAESEPGHGSTLRFRLPYRLDPPVGAAERAPTVGRPA